MHVRIAEIALIAFKITYFGLDCILEVSRSRCTQDVHGHDQL